MRWRANFTVLMPTRDRRTSADDEWSDRLFDRDRIYTHVVDASHRSAVEAVEDRLFVELARNGPKLTTELEGAKPASDSVN
jgi:hypothetical protein